MTRLAAQLLLLCCVQAPISAVAFDELLDQGAREAQYAADRARQMTPPCAQGKTLFHWTYDTCVPCQTSTACKLFCDPDSKAYRAFASPYCAGPVAPRHRINLMTAIFRDATVGPDEARLHHLPIFLKSVERSGVDVTIVGEIPPEIRLPANVAHVPMTWSSLCDLVSERVFGGDPVDHLRAASAYKVIDLKPLFGLLFADELAGYDFWGHVDNDLLLGNINHFFSADMLSNYDVIPGYSDPLEGAWTWGPFTLYRNAPHITRLFLQATDVYNTINSRKAHFFDEWGGDNAKPEEYNRTMSATVGRLSALPPPTGIRVYAAHHPLAWDHGCDDSLNRQCFECNLTTSAMNENKLTSLSHPNGNLDDLQVSEEVFICHYQFGKRTLHDQLENFTMGEIFTAVRRLPLMYRTPGGLEMRRHMGLGLIKKRKRKIALERLQKRHSEHSSAAGSAIAPGPPAR